MGCMYSLSEPQPDTELAMTMAAASATTHHQPHHTAKPTAAAVTAIQLSQHTASSSTVHTPIAQQSTDKATATSSASFSTRSRPSSTSSSHTLSSSLSLSSLSSVLSSAVRVQSLLCPIHPVCQPRPLSCHHCMRTSTALTSYPPVSANSSLPFVTAAQITSHWSARFVEQQLPHTPAAAAQHNTDTQPASSASYLAYLHSTTSASTTHSTAYSPSFLPSIKQPPLPVRRKQHFSVDVEASLSSESESSTELAILTQQLSAVRQQRRQRGLSSRRDEASSIEQSTSDSDDGTAAGKWADKWRTVSVARVSGHRKNVAEAEDDEATAVDCDVEVDDELTSPSIEEVDESERSVCQKPARLESAAQEQKTSEDDVAYQSVASAACVQFVEPLTDGW